MIADATTQNEISQEWEVIRRLRTWKRGVVLPFMFYNETPPNEFYTLPLILAYASLDNFLGQALVEGLFVCTMKNKNCFNLGSKMQSSIAPGSKIVWQDFTLVDEGKEARNKLAHESIIPSKASCLKYIQVVENEFIAWKLIK